MFVYAIFGEWGVCAGPCGSAGMSVGHGEHATQCSHLIRKHRTRPDACWAFEDVQQPCWLNGWHCGPAVCAGTFVTTAMFGKIMMSLYYRLLAKEGDMRFSLVRVREAAESIAFYGGERAEANVVRLMGYLAFRSIRAAN